MEDIESILNRILKEISDLKSGQTKDFLSVDETADFLGIPKSSVYQHSHKRTIPYFKTGKKLYFKRADLERYITQNHYRSREQLENE